MERLIAIYPFARDKSLFEIDNENRFFLIKNGEKVLRQPVHRFLLGYDDQSKIFIVSTRFPRLRFLTRPIETPDDYNATSLNKRVRLRNDYWVVSLKPQDAKGHDFSVIQKNLQDAADWFFDVLISGVPLDKKSRI